MKTREIQLNKTKLIALSGASMLFVVLGMAFVWGAYNGNINSSNLFNNTTAIFIIGLVAVVFFGFGLVLLLKKLKENKPGLVVSELGIFDNSSANSSGWIAWEDITDIQQLSVWGQKFIVIPIKNPKQLIDATNSFWKKKNLQANFKSYGSPININTGSLKIKHQELVQILEESFLYYKKP